MAVYAQHGYGKGGSGGTPDKVLAGLAAGITHGVVLSPRDLHRDQMATYVRQLSAAQPGACLLFDPQLFASVFPDATDGCLPTYGRYYEHGLRRQDLLRVEKIRTIAQGAVECQADLGLSRIITPAFMAARLDDTWTQVNMQLADEARQRHSALATDAGLLVGVVLDESALGDSDTTNEFLNIATEWDVQGFYVLIHHGSISYPAPFEPAHLANLMRIVFGLAHLNRYEVVCGQSDWVGLLLEAVGATAFATGWNLTLRQFTSTRWEPAAGGRQAVRRYSSGPLLGPVTIAELGRIREAHETQAVLSLTEYDQHATEEAWSRDRECLHHWAVLNGKSDELAQLPSVASKLNRVGEWLEAARKVFADLDHAGVELRHGHRPATGEALPPHLVAWRDAIGSFRLEHNI